MYNQYLDGSEFILLDPEPQNPTPSQSRQSQEQSRPLQSIAPQGQSRPKNDMLGEVTGGLSHLLEGVFKHFSLKNFDTGDILLVLIILFLYLEGDNLELVITLGLLLLLGLDGGEHEQEGEMPSCS